jgi:GntP family gluconate:H+ symporter
MDPLPSFLMAIILVSVLIPRLGPFLSLVISSVLYGLSMGMGAELMGYIATGMGRIFSSLAIVVFSGAIIAEYLRKTGAIDRIVADLLILSKRGMLVSGLAGYLISLPVMCSITAYLIVEPVVSCLGMQAGGSSRRFQFMTAAASVASFNLVYPSPVMVSLASSLALQPAKMLPIGLPISFLVFIAAYIYMLRLPSEKAEPTECPIPSIPRIRAWIPLVLPMGLILIGITWDFASFFSPSISLLIGALIGLALAREKTHEMVQVGSRRAGVIMLDICGAGAFGYVIAQSGLGREVYDLGHFLPVLLLPFIFSSVLQLAQGSRVVTAVVAAQVLSEYPLDGPTLALLISAGAFMLSYVSDPYFWLVRESTGASMGEMVKGYTLPLSIMGLAAFGAAALYSLLT